MCKSEHFICVNKWMASWAIKRLAAHVSLGESVISWYHAQQTDSCSDKSASGNGCVATIWFLQLQQPNSHSSGWYQLMEVSSCYCQVAVTLHGCGWLCGLITVLNWHSGSAPQITLVNYWLQVHYFSTGFNQVAFIMGDSWADTVVTILMGSY